MTLILNNYLIFKVLDVNNIGLQFLANGLSKSGTFHMKSSAFYEQSRFSCNPMKSAMLFSENAPSWKAQRFPVKSATFHHVNLWALGLSPSIGLSFERPIIHCYHGSIQMVELSISKLLVHLKMEDRLGHHLRVTVWVRGQNCSNHPWRLT